MARSVAGPRWVSPDLHAAIDDEIDARDVRALFAGEEQRHASTGLEVRPSRAREGEDQVHLVATVAVALLVADVLQPIEVRRGGVVEEQVDPAERAHGKVNERLAVGGTAWTTGMQRHHRSARLPNHLNGRLRGLHVQIAPHDRSTLSSEGQGSFTAHAPPCSRDDADLA